MSKHGVMDGRADIGKGLEGERREGRRDGARIDHERGTKSRRNGMIGEGNN